MTEVPQITPIKLTEFQTRQSKYKMVGKLPTRALLVGPSGSGKGVLLSNMILDIYRDCFSRIFIFSPSIHVDHTWRPVKDYIKKQLKVEDTEKEPIYFSEYDPVALEDIISTQHKITKYMKTFVQTFKCTVDGYYNTPRKFRNCRPKRE